MRQTEGRSIWQGFLSLLLALALCLSTIPAQAWAVEEELTEDGAEAVTEEVTEEAEVAEAETETAALETEAAEPETEATELETEAVLPETEDRTEVAEPERVAGEPEETEVTADAAEGESNPAEELSEETVEESVVEEAALGVINSGKCGDHLTWTLDDAGKLTIKGKGKIWDYVLSQNSKIKSVVIQQGVTSIGEYNFSSCDNLTSVSIPNSVTSIGEYAFEDCGRLTSITVSKDNTSYCSVGGVLFSKGKTELIHFPGGKSGSYTIPNSVKKIRKSAFYGCSGLTSIVIPNSVTKIEDSAFMNCSSLSSVSIGNRVTSIGDDVFGNCSSLTSVSIPKSVTTIGERAFYQCYDLTSVSIPNSVTSIGMGAFYNCYSLTSVNIPNSVTSIEKAAFECCFGLTSVSIPNSVTSIGPLAFWQCSLYNASIPSSLTSVSIPSSVTSIGYNAFGGSSLTSINVSNGNKSYRSVDGVLFSKDKTELIQVPGGRSGSYTIPDSVTSICIGAFSNCCSLTSVSIPHSVTSIGDTAFLECSSLTSISIPDSVTSIGCMAFCCCSNLTSVSIPDSVTSIGEEAFDGGNNMTIYGYADSAAQRYAKANNISFRVIKKIPINSSSISITIPAQPYTGNALTPNPKVVRNGKALTKGKDYTVSYKNNKETGTATATITGKGNYTGSVTKKFTIYVATPKTLNVQTVNGGVKITCSKVSGAAKYRYLYKKSNKWTKIADSTSTSYTWKKAENGKTYSFTVQALNKSGKVIGTYNKVGKSITYLAAPSITKVTNSQSKTMTVKWGKKADVTGYQIQYSLNKTFKSAKTVTVKGTNATSKAIGSLAKGKTYYVRMRTYYGNTKKVSAWSVVKTVKISK